MKRHRRNENMAGMDDRRRGNRRNNMGLGFGGGGFGGAHEGLSIPPMMLSG